MTATTNDSPALFNPAETRRALEFFLPVGQWTELRALEATTNGDRWAGTHTGYFAERDKLIAALGTLKSAKGIYITPNPVDPALSARAHNRIRKAGKNESTSDSNITGRRWLLIDCDAKRPSGVSATDSEHLAALKRAQAIADDVHFNYGWPDPIIADSGNGGHLVYRIDEPADDGGLVERCLHALAVKFTDDNVKVDTTVHNAARIWKLYGTLTCKGDSTEDRPHRMSRIIKAPATAIAVSRQQLESLASEAAAGKGKTHDSHSSNGAAFDIDGFISRNGLEVCGPDSYNGGRKWTFTRSPLCDHHDDGPYLIQFASGALSAGCHHESCSWAWADLRNRFEPYKTSNDGSARAADTTQHRAAIERLTFGQLLTDHPKLNPPLIDGLLRLGETCNVISYSKVGKSWLIYGLGLSILLGRKWLGKFETKPGKVLLLDNELHPGTLANRIPAVAEAMGLIPSQYSDKLHVVCLRGRLRSFGEVAIDLDIKPGEYQAILCDAKYRFSTAGTSENDNAAETAFYNELDRFAERTGAALILVHHASKGSQSDKRVTDVGAGAGAQSRAADCHLVLREHEEEGVVVLEAAVRSFAPVEPVAIRWNYPQWVPANDVDPFKLKGKKTRTEERQNDKDREGMDATLTALIDGPLTARALRRITGFGEYRQERLLDLLTSSKQIVVVTKTIGSKSFDEYLLT